MRNISLKLRRNVMSEQKSRKLDAVIILAFALAGFAVSLISFFWRQQNQIKSFVFAVECVFYLAVAVYGIWGYRKPHGNLLRYLILLLSLVTVATVQLQLAYCKVPWGVVICGNAAAVFMGYMAGRLGKVKKNRYVVAIVTLLLLIRCCWPVEQQYAALSVFYVLDRSTNLFAWITAVLIYFFRYKEHKEAGLMTDAGKAD